MEANCLFLMSSSRYRSLYRREQQNIGWSAAQQRHRWGNANYLICIFATSTVRPCVPCTNLAASSSSSCLLSPGTPRIQTSLKPPAPTVILGKSIYSLEYSKHPSVLFARDLLKSKRLNFLINWITRLWRRKAIKPIHLTFSPLCYFSLSCLLYAAFQVKAFPEHWF